MRPVPGERPSSSRTRRSPIHKFSVKRKHIQNMTPPLFFITASVPTKQQGVRDKLIFPLNRGQEFISSSPPSHTQRQRGVKIIQHSL